MQIFMGTNHIATLYLLFQFFILLPTIYSVVPEQIRFELTVQYRTSVLGTPLKFTGNPQVFIKHDPALGASTPPLRDFTYIEETNTDKKLTLNNEGKLIFENKIDIYAESNKKFFFRVQLVNDNVDLATNIALNQRKVYYFDFPLHSFADYELITSDCRDDVRTIALTYTIPKNVAPSSHKSGPPAYKLITLFNSMSLIVDTTWNHLLVHRGGPRPTPIKLDYPWAGTTEVHLSVMRVEQNDYMTHSILAHEYGHYVMTREIGYDIPGLMDVDSHDDCEYSFFDGTPKQAEELSWSEGYADGFSLILCDLMGLDNPGYYHYYTLGISRYKDMELYDCFENSDLSNGGMKNDEGRIAAVMWDLYDGAKPQFVNNEQDNRGYKGYGSADPPPGLTVLGDRNAGESVRLTPYEILVEPLVLLRPKIEYDKKDVVGYYNVIMNDMLKQRTPLNQQKIDETLRIFCYNYLKHDDCNNT